MESLLYIIAAVILVVLMVIFRETAVPRLLKISGYIAAFVAGFLPVYSVNIMGDVFSGNVLNFICGVNLNLSMGYDISIGGSLFYIVIPALPVIGAVVVLISDGKGANIINALIALAGIFIDCLMLFKQIEIGDIVKITIDIGIVLSFIAYGVVLISSIIKIYGTIHNDNLINDDSDEEFDDEEKEDIADYFQNSEKINCPNCGQENIKGCNYCKKCGEKM